MGGSTVDVFFCQVAMSCAAIGLDMILLSYRHFQLPIYFQQVLKKTGKACSDIQYSTCCN